MIMIVYLSIDIFDSQRGFGDRQTNRHTFVKVESLPWLKSLYFGIYLEITTSNFKIKFFLNFKVRSVLKYAHSEVHTINHVPLPDCITVDVNTEYINLILKQQNILKLLSILIFAALKEKQYCSMHIILSITIKFFFISCTGKENELFYNTEGFMNM